jgi:hypothetical protein
MNVNRFEYTNYVLEASRGGGRVRECRRIVSESEKSWER